MAGAGKSTFVRLASGVAPRAQTSIQPLPVPFKMGNQEITLIDMPAIDAITRSEKDVNDKFADVVKRTCGSIEALIGVIYIHRISDQVDDGIAGATAPVLHRICGEMATKNMMIVTSMWDMEQEKIATENEDKLHADIFEGVLGSEAQMLRHHNTHQSAQYIIWEVIARPSLTKTYSRLEVVSQRSSIYPSKQLFKQLLSLCRGLLNTNVDVEDHLELKERCRHFP